MTPLIAELPYRPDSSELFGPIAHRPWAMLLDSGRPGSTYGRYDILVADPVITLVTRGDLTEISSPTGHEISRDDPFGLVRDYLGRQQERHEALPFMGGAVGYFSYDLARRLERLPSIAADAEHLPEMQVGIYDWAVVVDHQERRSWLASYGRAPLTHERWETLVAQFRDPIAVAPGDFRVSAVSSNMDAASYGEAFRKVLHYIHEGDCYQVNLAQRFEAAAEGDAWAAYRRLRQQSPAPFAAYLNLPDAQVLSASPERFLQVREHGQVETRPIKGTRPRSQDAEQDRRHAEELQASLKDRAENVMIVDLLRNDIGKNCLPGTVRAERMFELESFQNVHHLVSTVTGRLAPGHTAMHLLRGCFPGGSITGAPKLRAMQIIEELEPHRRGIYCGAIGYIGFDGSMDTNIAIRTAVHAQGSIRFWAGGGIVADSQESKEYRETLDKAANMLALMESFRVGR